MTTSGFLTEQIDERGSDRARSFTSGDPIAAFLRLPRCPPAFVSYFHKPCSLPCVWHRACWYTGIMFLIRGDLLTHNKAQETFWGASLTLLGSSDCQLLASNVFAPFVVLNVFGELTSCEVKFKIYNPFCITFYQRIN